MTATKAAKTPGKGNALAGILQRKGEATKPAGAPQRGEGEVSQDAKPQDAKGKFRALTLRLEEKEYQALRAFAFRRGLTHQPVMLDALRRHLEGEDSAA